MNYKFILLFLILIQLNYCFPKISNGAQTKLILMEMCDKTAFKSENKEIGKNKIEFLCNDALSFLTKPAIFFCTFAVNLWSGNVNCEQALTDHLKVLHLETICQNSINMWKHSRCSNVPKEKLACCLDESEKAASTIIPKCNEITDTIIKLKTRVCNMNKAEAIHFSTNGCTTAVELAAEIPFKICLQIFGY
uniref:Uncharacterized protein n=1 Tax=Meloidogyne enterolobii TaxID=390850 RepID=A0A6V7W8Y4_MELEN|nr:unnamed protein product [Meloidogyne enterolobii]